MQSYDESTKLSKTPKRWGFSLNYYFFLMEQCKSNRFAQNITMVNKFDVVGCECLIWGKSNLTCMNIFFGNNNNMLIFNFRCRCCTFSCNIVSFNVKFSYKWEIMLMIDVNNISHHRICTVNFKYNILLKLVSFN